MASFLLPKFFQNKITNSGLSKDSQNSLKFLLTEAKITAFDNASSKLDLKIQSNSLFQDCSSLIQKMLTKTFDIERHIKKKQFKEALKQKKELENKLSQISENIKSFKILEDLKTQYSKPKRMTKNSRKLYFENEKKKVEALAEKIQKFAEMHKKTENFLRTQGEKIEEKQKQSEEWEKQQLELIKSQKEQQRLEELEKLRKKTENSHKELEKIRRNQSESNLYLNSKPLYMKLEENYKNTVELPELEKRKEELKRKRLYFSSIQHESLKDHLKWYNSIKENNANKIKRELANKNIDWQLRSSTVVSIWNKIINEEEKQREEEKIKKKTKKKELLERQQKYSQLIKELHSPTTKSTSEKPEKYGKKDKSRLKNEKNHEETLKVWKPHKFSVNPMIPPPKVTLIPKPVYYLEERRKFRKEANGAVSTRHKVNNLVDDESFVSSLSAQNIKKVKKKAFEFEEIARKQEIFLHKNPSTVFSIKKTASVDNLIISSIKAKLMILDHIEKEIN